MVFPGLRNAFIVLLALSFVCMGPVIADESGWTPIDGPVNITEPGSYYLAGDILSTDADVCIGISASDVILDGRGHTVSGTGADDTLGVSVQGPEGGVISNVSVMNLSVSDFEVGISYVRGEGGVISGNLMTGNNHGMTLAETSHALVTGNNASAQVLFGMVNGVGILLSKSTNNTITGNTLIQNGAGGEAEFGGQGIYIAGSSSGNTVSGNTIHDNAVVNILLDTSCDENTLSSNDVQGSINGIIIDNQCTGNALYGNRVNGSVVGIGIASSSGTVMRSNVMAGNTNNFWVNGDAEEHFLQDVDISNTVDGKPVYYLVGVTGKAIGPAENPGTIYCVDCDTISIGDVTLTKNGYGALFWSSFNITLGNVTCNEDDTGLAFFDDTRSVVLTGIIANGNAEYGLLMYQVENITLADSTADQNQIAGISIEECRDIAVRNSSASRNNGGGEERGIGIDIDSCQEVSLERTVTSSNLYFGILLDDTDGLIITDGVADENEELGIVAVSSRDVTISGMRLSGNDVAGLGIEELSHSSIDNNYFNNTQNVDFADPGATTTAWNRTKTAGENIVRGPYLGGNYWASPDGIGWSQVTPDRGDGFCTAPYVLDVHNTDYLPLHLRLKPAFYADFSARPVSGPAPLSVSFTDASEGSPDFWSYTFGDGLTSTARNPVHTYWTPGTYTVNLTILKVENGMLARNTTVKQNLVTVGGGPDPGLAANFTASPLHGPAPLRVTFTDASTGNPRYWNYDFGDGTYSTAKNPVHTYLRTGNYTVTLTVFRVDRGTLVKNVTTRHDLVRVG
jgi:PKD repeat protein